MIDARWGAVPIPGSPFRIRCTETQFQVRGAPKRVVIGSSLEVKVHQTSGPPLGEGESLEVVSKVPRGREVVGMAALTNGEEQIYTCTLTPTVTGNHMVGIKWNRLHIKGSPFAVKVVVPPKPERVRVYGVGVEGGGEAGQGAEFTVDTSAAGNGLLAIRVHAPSRELTFDTAQDSKTKRMLHVRYCPPVPGRYTVEVTWSSTHVPGSPFTANFLPPRREDKIVVIAEVHYDSDNKPHPSPDGSNEAVCPEDVSLGAERPEDIGLEAVCPETIRPDTVRPESISVNMEGEMDNQVPNFPEEPETAISLHDSSSGYADPEIADASQIGAAPPTLQSYSMGASEDSNDVPVGGRDSAYATSSEKNPGSLDRTEVHRFLPYQESEDSTHSLYVVPQLSSRRLSNEHIAVHVEGDMSFA